MVKNTPSFLPSFLWRRRRQKKSFVRSFVRFLLARARSDTTHRCRAMSLLLLLRKIIIIIIIAHFNWRVFTPCTPPPPKCCVFLFDTLDDFFRERVNNLRSRFCARVDERDKNPLLLKPPLDTDDRGDETPPTEKRSSSRKKSSSSSSRSEKLWNKCTHHHTHYWSFVFNDCTYI